MIVWYMLSVYIPFPVGFLYIVETSPHYKRDESTLVCSMQPNWRLIRILLPTVFSITSMKIFTKKKKKIRKIQTFNIWIHSYLESFNFNLGKIILLNAWYACIFLLSCLLTFEKVQSRNLFILKINDICKSRIAVRRQSIYLWVLCHISVNSLEPGSEEWPLYP